MGFGITFGGKLAKLVEQNDPAGMSAVGSGLLAAVTAGSFYYSLHTAAPASPHNDQTSNEIPYPNYARQAAARSTGGATVASTNVSSNAAALTWPACGTTGSTFTATHWAIGEASSGVCDIVLLGTITTPLTFGQAVSPLAGIGAITRAWQ